MAVRTIVSCDTPDCKRTIDLSVHANTWLTLIRQRIRQPTTQEMNFCSYYCLAKWVEFAIQVERNTDLD